jgi:H+/Cl- antiporter ClcA
MQRLWVLFISVVLGAMAGVVGYLAWLLQVSNNDWWPWALVGGIVGLAVGVVAAWWEAFAPTKNSQAL